MKVSTVLAFLAAAATGNSLTIPTNRTHLIHTGITVSSARIFHFLQDSRETANVTSTGNSSVVTPSRTYKTVKGSTVQVSKYYVVPRPVVNVTRTGNHTHVVSTNRTHYTHAGIKLSSVNITSSILKTGPKVENSTVNKHVVKMEVTTGNGLPGPDRPLKIGGITLHHGSRLATKITRSGSSTKESKTGNDEPALESDTSTKAAEPTKTPEATKVEKPASKSQDASEFIGKDEPTTHQIPNRERKINSISKGGQ